MRTKWLQTLLLASVAFACSEDGQGEDPLPEAAIIGPGGGTLVEPYEMKWEQRNDDETSIVTATCTIGK